MEFWASIFTLTFVITRTAQLSALGAGHILPPKRVVGTRLYIYIYIYIYVYIYAYIGFKTFFYVVLHLNSIASHFPTGLHLGFFRSWPSLFLTSSFSSVFLELSFVLASISMLLWVVFILPYFEYGRTM